MASHLELPGMALASVGSGPVVHRAAPNVWWLGLATEPVVTAETLRALDPTSLPSAALSAADRSTRSGRSGRGATAVVAKLELDACGAWLTVANAGPDRPVVVRRAGWVDLRGHPSESLGGGAPYAPADDRVGLGPGDVLVLRVTADEADGTTDDDVLDACLRVVGAAPDDMVGAVRSRAPGEVVAVGVPGELGPEPLLRVAAATGVPADEVQSPGYPLGDLQPDLWRQPPRPPRLAQLRLGTDRSGVASVRALLDRLLASWRVGDRVDSDDLKLVATELAANAVVHSGDPEAVTVRYLGDVVRIEVVDRSPRQPQPLEPTDDGLGGRGMHLIEALSSAWGSEPLDDGKRVWCDLAVAG